MGIVNYLEIPGFSYYCYAMLCRDGKGPLYVKFGHSRRIGQRLSELRTSCPIPARYFAIIQCPHEARMKKVEKALHEEFKSRRVSGEWFKFDPDKPEDKEAFNQGCTSVFLAELGKGFRWEKISVAQLDNQKAFYRALHVSSKGFRAKCRREQARRAAQRELSR